MMKLTLQNLQRLHPARWLLKLSRWQKRAVSIGADLLGLLLISVLAVWLRLGESVFPLTPYWGAIVLLPVAAVPVFIKYGLYRAVIRYIGQRFALTVFLSVTALFVLWAALIFFFDLKFPRSAIVIAWLLALLYIAGSRLFARWLLAGGSFQNEHQRAVLIFGAGSSGQQLLSAMHNIPGVKVVGFVDDSKQLQGNDIHSVRVYGRKDLEFLIASEEVKEVFLAVPSIARSQKQKILNWLEPYPVKVSTLPPMDEIVDGKVSFADVREVEIEDLLGRDVVPPQNALLDYCIKDKVVMVTGAGGSIGSELARQVIKLKPKQLILFELSEFSLYEIDQELCSSDVEVLSFLGSVRDKDKVSEVLSHYAVDTIYHAAAYKHVPLVEHNIAEGVQNNALGTLCLAKQAAQYKVANFVLISTDKAVRPTNFMGASKRMAELSLQALQPMYPETRFVMVRFGNVLGSSGSVIPLFRRQIEKGGPITVTHPEINRFFMTIPEAASLVIQAGSMGQGRDVFVLDMGEPVKIVDLAKRMVRLSGLELVDETGHGDIDIEFTGLRPGEKLYEELLIGDNVSGTDHPKIMRANEASIDLEDLEAAFAEITDCLRKNDYEGCRSAIEKIVSGFNHQSRIVDYFAPVDEVTENLEAS
ncbi:MAG: nucleoside-diphosphate sugar epimerase/dehydratase [Hydrogenovibrio sp.]|uniref:polysaccharide biosynthesis protein n=1 Tax=Hydrogenovibrio sp. TaxID=2065821 RepID=UPI00286FE6FF|nr:nucleoside-diphosphate sugar epimerase/dehydratase [Hydrogenovibrio sp.]MDR9498537.1 nucleoside-diphosphate sugar epimerase/dehydratase [Hydrogenovibrio sp.]MDR9499233.1 nucleoside-diphosphate sugar epimerase/dehydratase [Hydrogenovibrio sp.]